jgi:hypothetical protein
VTPARTAHARTPYARTAHARTPYAPTAYARSVPHPPRPPRGHVRTGGGSR